jgi:hypothetical protein
VQHNTVNGSSPSTTINVPEPNRIISVKAEFSRVLARSGLTVRVSVAQSGPITNRHELWHDALPLHAAVAMG